MSDTKTDTGKHPMAPRNVEYGELAVMDELPGRPTKQSPIQETLEKLKKDREKHGKWVAVAKYANGSAATAAANVERRRRGQDATISGWEFATRRVDGGDGTLLFVKYEPGLVEGSPEERHQRHQTWLKDRAQKTADKRAAREKDEKSSKAAAGARKAS